MTDRPPILSNNVNDHRSRQVRVCHKNIAVLCGQCCQAKKVIRGASWATRWVDSYQVTDAGWNSRLSTAKITGLPMERLWHGTPAPQMSSFQLRGRGCGGQDQSPSWPKMKG